MASAGTLVGLETPAESKNLETQALRAGVGRTTTAPRRPALDDDLGGNGGLDFKYGLTRSLIADVTFNTDFAQVEEDLQQVNLTRFSLFFPEKRDFFLEGQGIFAFRRRAGRQRPRRRAAALLQPPDRAQPGAGGAGHRRRAPDRPHRALQHRRAQHPYRRRSRPPAPSPTDFSALRLKRNILRRSNLGIMATRRGPGATSGAGGDASYTVGADATLLFFKSINLTAYAARTHVPVAGRVIDGTSYRGRFDYTDDRYGVTAEHMLVDRGFNPDLGFARRTDVRRTFAQARFSPRPRRSRLVRKLTWQAGLDYVTDAGAAELQAREASGLFRVDFQSSDQASLEYSREFELLPAPFAVAPGVIVPPGGYAAETTRAGYTMGQQRRVSGRLSVARGTLYDGTRSEATYSGRWGVLPQLSIEPSLSLNRAVLPYGTFNARLLSSRVTVTPSARMLISSLVQFNVDAHTLSSSVRLRWEYTGGSELFVVYSDGRDTEARPATRLQNRTLAVKATRLFRF